VSELQGIARFKFREGKLEEFKRLSDVAAVLDGGNDKADV
jgi:hypothetical protein